MQAFKSLFSRFPMLRRYLIVAALSLICETGLQGADDATNATLRKVLSTFVARRELMNPIFAKYRITTAETADWVKATAGPDSNHAAGARDVLIEAQYARKGVQSLTRIARVKPELVGGPEGWLGLDFTLYNGYTSVWKSGKEGEYMISKKPANRTSVQSPLEFARELPVLQTLQDWADQTMATSAMIAKTEYAGQPELLVTLVFTKTGWKNKIWLMPDREYVVRRCEVYNSADEPVSRVEVTSFRDVNGVPFPMAATETHYMSKKRLGYTAKMEVLNVEMDARGVPDSLFQFEFPATATIYDTDLKVFVRRTEVAESHLNEAIERLAPPSLLRRWMYVALVPIAVGAVALVLLRWRKRRAALVAAA